MKNIAIVVPLDFTAFLCNKYMVLYLLQQKETSKVYVVGQKTDKTNYQDIIESWGAYFLPLVTPRHISVIQDINYTLQLRNIFKKHNIDTVINVTTKPNVYGPISAKLAGINNIFTGVWGRGTAFNEDKNLKRVIVRFFLKRFLKNSFSISNLTWVTNPTDYDFFIREGMAKSDSLFLTKNYIDCNYFSRSNLNLSKINAFKEKFSILPDEFVVMLVGRMIWPKGVGEFAEASHLLKESNPKIRFILVGAEEHESPDKVPTEKLIEWSSSPNFDWVGYQEDILNLYGICDLAVLPSYYKEGGYPRALTEPMSLEIPVISSDSIDCREPVKDGYNGFRVQTKNSKELAEKIKELAENPDLCSTFGQNSRIRVLEEYNEEIIMKSVVNKFVSVIE